MVKSAFEIGKSYEVDDFRNAHYFALKSIRLNPQLAEKYRTHRAIRWKRGNDNYLVVRETGLLRVISHYSSEPEGKTKLPKSRLDKNGA